MFEGISAVTLLSHDIQRSIAFYRALGLRVVGTYDEGRFATLQVGSQALNLIETTSSDPIRFWGRIIIYVADVDALHRRATEMGFEPEDVPRDASWGERYFHVRDPDGHELSFARRL